MFFAYNTLNYKLTFASTVLNGIGQVILNLLSFFEYQSTLMTIIMYTATMETERLEGAYLKIRYYEDIIQL